MSGYENWIDHTLDRLGVIPHGETFDLKDEADLDRYATVITHEGVKAVVRTATARILIASPSLQKGRLADLSDPREHERGSGLNYFDPEDRAIDPLQPYVFPMIIVDGPSLFAKGAS